MIDINDFLEEFTEEQKQDFYSLYNDLNKSAREFYHIYMVNESAVSS